MTNENFINKLIAKWEDDTTEFKSSIEKDKVGKTICAFANDINNKDVGYLVIGVEEKSRTIIGLELDNWDKIQQLFANICSSINPPVIPQLIKIKSKDNKTIILVKVNRSMFRPHRFKGKCYIRVLSTTRAANFEEEKDLKQKSTASYQTFDALPNTRATLDDLDNEKIIEHYKETRGNDFFYVKDNLSVETILKKGFELACEVEGKYFPCNSALLMFGKAPNRFFPNAYINAIRFKGLKEGGTMFDRTEINGTLDSILISALNFIKRFLVTESTIETDSLLRFDIKEYPELALREAVANAIIHRDYSDIHAPPIDLYMFDDRIEIRNYGGLPGGLKLEDLGTGKRYLRNPTIATFMYEKRWIEKAGTGIIRIFYEMTKNESPNPRFEVDDNFVKIILPSNFRYKAFRYIEDGRNAAFRGEINKAKDFFMEATKVCPDSTEAWLAFGQLLMENDEFIEARQCFEKAQHLSPGSSTPLLRLAGLENRERRDNSYPTRVRELYAEASEIDPNNPILFHKWGVFEKDHNNFTKASELFKRSTRLDQNSYVCWQSWGQTEVLRKNYQYGISLLEKAKVLAEQSGSSTLSWIYCDIAWTYYKMRRPKEEVIKYFEEAIKANPNDQNSIRRYAGYLQKIGQEEKAYNLRKKIGRRESWKKPEYDDFRIKKFPVKSINNLKIGEKVTGKVVNVVNFGAFVDIGVEYNALLHISEISDKFVDIITDFISIGDIRKFKVIYLNTKENKIQLSLKQTK